MKMIKPTAPHQFIHFNGFALPGTDEVPSVVFGMDGFSKKLFDPQIFHEAYSFSNFVEYIQCILDRPEVKQDWKKITVVTDVDPQYVKAIKHAVGRPVKFVGNYLLNEKAVKETRDGIRNSWTEYASNMLFSLAS